MSVWWAAVNTAPASAKSPPCRLEWYLLITLTYCNVKWKKEGPHCRGTLGLSVVCSLQLSKLGCKRDDTKAAGYLTAPDHLLLLMLGSKMSHVYGGRPAWSLKISLLNATFFAYPLFLPAGHWDSMEEYTCMIPRDTHDGAFYRAVLALHQDLFSLAQQVSSIKKKAFTRYQFHQIPFSECKKSICFSVYIFRKDLIMKYQMGFS